MALRLTLLLIVTCLVQMATAQSVQNLTVYYPTWCMRALDDSDYGNPADRLYFPTELVNNVYIVIFMDGNVQTISPYWGARVNNAAGIADSLEFYHGVAGTAGDNMGQLLITEAHAAGAKVVLTIQAVDAAELNFVAEDSTRSHVFSDAAADFAFVFGADGLELNWEDWITPITTAANVNRLTRILHRALVTRYSPTTPVLLSSASRLDATLYYGVQDTCFTLYNLQCYNMQQGWDPDISNNRQFVQTAVTRGTDWVAAHPNAQFQAMDYNFATQEDSIVVIWENAGHLRTKLSLGLGVYGYIHLDNSNIFDPQTNSAQDLGTFEMLDLVNYGGTYVYDAVRKAPYIHGTAVNSPPYWFLTNGQEFMALYEDSTSLWDKVEAANAHRYGGIMLYDFKGTHRNNMTDSLYRNPEVYWTAKAIANFSGSAVVPTVTTTALSAVTTTTMSSGGNVTDDGGAAVTARGVCWNYTGTPTTSDNTTSDGSGTGSFTSAITGLLGNRTVYVRSYATNSVGDGYGSELSTTTLRYMGFLK